MANYNAQKIYSELDKLENVNELYVQLQNIKEFVLKRIQQEKEQSEEKSTELQRKIDLLTQY
jgi:hypothetical protein